MGHRLLLLLAVIPELEKAPKPRVGGVNASIYTFVKFALFEKALSPMLVTELGKVILEKTLLIKAPIPMLVTEFGIIILVQELLNDTKLN